jgi:hypothetical protein
LQSHLNEAGDFSVRNGAGQAERSGGQRGAQATVAGQSAPGRDVVAGGPPTSFITPVSASLIPSMIPSAPTPACRVAVGWR